MEEINWLAVEAVATVCAVFVAFLAFMQATKANRSQRELAKLVHSQQMTLGQRQIIIELFRELKDISSIDSDKPVWPDVVKAVNYLDLLGICWEGEMVDETILFRVYRNFFIDTYEQIERCQSPDPQRIKKDGKAMLSDSRSATALYRYLKNQYQAQDQPASLGVANVK